MMLMEIATFVLAIIGAVTGVGSLAWQINTWNQSGPVITVTALQALPTYGDRVGDPLVNVTARNSGRSPVTITGWGLEFLDGQTMVLMQQLRMSTPLPHRLEEGASGSWFIETKDVRDECASRGIRYQDLCAFVNLADGRTIKAKRPGIGLK
jgi:hypothetical protein